MKILYKTSAVSTGGRDGKVIVENSPLEFEMATPAELGGIKKEGANPEQLFAAGYAACFGSALQHVLRGRKMTIAIPTIHMTVGLGKNETGGFSLAVDIVAVFKVLTMIRQNPLFRKPIRSVRTPMRQEAILK